MIFLRKELVPNYLTCLRIIITPLIISTFYLKDFYLQKLISGTLFLFACLTDFFDGYLARKFSFQSELGRVLDPIADKILVSSLFIMLIKYKNINEIPCLIILAREFLISGIRSNLKINSFYLAKVKTFLQMLSIFLFLIFDNNESFSGNFYFLGSILLWISSFITLKTGYTYFSKYINNI